MQILKSSTLGKILVVALTICLLVTAVPVKSAFAKPVPNLTVDVWMDKGGQGQGMSGGQYSLGEIPTIYWTASIGCQTRLTLSGPDGTSYWEQPAMYGPVYQKTLGDAEQSDIGQWTVTLQAMTTTGGLTASDTTSFTVVGPSAPPPAPTPTPTIPSSPPPTLSPATTPSTTPSTTPGSSSAPATSSLRTAATILEALKASKMVEGALPVSLTLDANNDGRVTIDDARLILQWAIENKARLSLEQYVVKMEMAAPNTWDVPYEPITGVATPEQGAVIQTDGMKLTIPPGAVSADTQIIVKELKQPPPFLSYKTEYSTSPWVMAFGTVYDFGPEGLEFQQPVQIILSYDETMLPPGSSEESIVPVYFNGVDWISMPAGVDTQRNTVSIRTSSFPGQFIEFTAWGLTKAALATGSAIAVWYYGGGGEAVVSQWAKDPVYYGKAAEYVRPGDSVVRQFAERVIAETGKNKFESFGSEAELAEIMKNPMAGERLIRFNFGRKATLGPNYTKSDSWANDWLRPADYAAGDLKGDCKNIANFYCSVLRNLEMNAKCVDGYMNGGRHVWVEVEIDGKAYYLGESGELAPLEDSVKKLKLTRPKGVEGQGFMWDENGQVPYKENWWEKGKDWHFNFTCEDCERFHQERPYYRQSGSNLCSSPEYVDESQFSIEECDNIADSILWCPNYQAWQCMWGREPHSVWDPYFDVRITAFRTDEDAELMWDEFVKNCKYCPTTASQAWQTKLTQQGGYIKRFQNRIEYYYPSTVDCDDCSCKGQPHGSMQIFELYKNCRIEVRWTNIGDVSSPSILLNDATALEQLAKDFVDEKRK